MDYTEEEKEMIAKMNVFTSEQEEMMAGLKRTNRLSDIIEAARIDLIRSAARRMLRAQIESGNIMYADLKEAVSVIGAEHFKPQKVGRKSQSAMKFITINAKDNIDVHQFLQQMEKCIKKQKLQAKRASYVIEQRSEGDQDPYGWHIHWLVEFDTTTSSSVIIQQVAQCFQRFIAGSNYVDVKDVYDDDQWSQKMSYIMGTKKADKMPKVEKDRVLRASLRLPQIFSY